MSSRSRRGESSKSSANGYTSEASSESSHMEGGRRKVSLDKDSDEYKKRRERNNEAVKKSRSKAKEKTSATVERVNILKEENNELNQKINILSKEYDLLKEMLDAQLNKQAPYDNAAVAQTQDYIDERLMDFQDYAPIGHVKMEPRHQE